MALAMATSLTSIELIAQLQSEGKITGTDAAAISALVTQELDKASEPRTQTLRGNITLTETAILHTLEPAFEVLNTPELLESILLRLPVKTLIEAVPLVCRVFRNAMESSTTLKTKVFRLPESASRFEAFPPTIPGVSFELTPTYSLDGLGLVLNKQDKDLVEHHYLAMETGLLPKNPGKSLRETQLCKPPIKLLMSNHTDYMVSDAFIRDPQGITVGHLIDICEIGERRRPEDWSKAGLLHLICHSEPGAEWEYSWERPECSADKFVDLTCDFFNDPVRDPKNIIATV